MEQAKKKKHIEQLQQMYEEHRDAENKKGYAKNKKDREAADRIMDNVRERAEQYMLANGDLYDFLVGDGTGTDKAFFHDDFFHFRYFTRNMQSFIERLNK